MAASSQREGRGHGQARAVASWVGRVGAGRGGYSFLGLWAALEGSCLVVCHSGFGTTHLPTAAIGRLSLRTHLAGQKQPEARGGGRPGTHWVFPLLLPPLSPLVPPPPGSQRAFSVPTKASSFALRAEHPSHTQSDSSSAPQSFPFTFHDQYRTIPS